MEYPLSLQQWAEISSSESPLYVFEESKDNYKTDQEIKIKNEYSDHLCQSIDHVKWILIVKPQILNLCTVYLFVPLII